MTKRGGERSFCRWIFGQGWRLFTATVSCNASRFARGSFTDTGLKRSQNMSVPLGLYDVFSYFIPGVLYLFTINELLRIVGWNFVDVVSWIKSESAPSTFIVFQIIVCAYVVGHILDPMANTFFLRIINRVRKLVPASEVALRWQRELHPKLDIKFEAQDWFLLYNLISQRNIEVARDIDKYQADSIMMRNIAFGSFLLFCVQIGGYFSAHKSIFLINGLVAVLVSIFAYLRSIEFRTWYFSRIFEASLEYGLSLEKVVKYNHEKNSRHGAPASAGSSARRRL